MKKYLRLDEILSKTFIYSFIFLKMKILLAKPGELPEKSTRPTGLTLALASGQVLISNPTSTEIFLSGSLTMQEKQILARVISIYKEKIGGNHAVFTDN